MQIPPGLAGTKGAIIWKRRIHALLNGDEADTFARALVRGLVILITANVVAVILETVPYLQTRHSFLFTAFEVFSTIIVASSLVYFAEHRAQPEAFSSIPAAMWWGVVTLTTVGYGDVYPVTPIGKLLGGLMAILGIGLFALPAGILGAGFLEEMQRKRSPRICPHCGKELGEPTE